MEKDASFFFIFQKKIELLFKQTYFFCCCYWLIFRIPNSINFYPILCSQLNIYIFFSSNWKFPISILNIHPVSSSATTKPNKTNKSFFPLLFNRLEISFEKNVEILLKKRGNSFLNEKKHNTSIQFGNVYLFCCLFVWFGVSGNRIEFIIHSKIFESLITHSLCVFWMFFQSKKITKICFSVQKNKNIEVTRKKGKSKVCNL